MKIKAPNFLNYSKKITALNENYGSKFLKIWNEDASLFMDDFVDVSLE